MPFHSVRGSTALVLGGLRNAVRRSRHWGGVVVSHQNVTFQEFHFISCQSRDA